jgi:hypothetical protein
MFKWIRYGTNQKTVTIIRLCIGPVKITIEIPP